MPIESSYPRIVIPDLDLWEFLFERSDREYPDDKVIYTDSETNRSYTYARVRSAALDFGKGLRGLWDWQKGDVLALFTPNCIDTPAVTWGCHWAGGVLSPANPGYTTEELTFQLKDAGAKALVTQLPLIETARKAARAAGLHEDRIILIGDAQDPSGRVKHFASIRNVSGVAGSRRPRITASEDLAFLVYSSGTTGHPKGVMLTHTNIVSNVLMLRAGEAGEAGGLTWHGGPDGQGDKVLAFLPFFHIYGLTVLIHQAIHVGFTLIVLPKFDIERFCELVQEHRITFSYVVPPVVLLLSKHPVVDMYDLSSIRMLNSGAAPLTKELVRALWDRLRVPIKQGYGLSETSPTTHTQPWDEWDKSIGSVGKLLPNQVAKYISLEEGEEKEVPVGQTGELWIRGPNVFKGYLNNPAMTAYARTADGFFKTGDIGHQDWAGNFYITDRVKELIKYKGFPVAPAELEGLLLGHDAVADVAVVPVDRTAVHATEVPRAYVVLAPGRSPTDALARDIAAWLADRVAGHKRLRGGVHFIEEIPKSVSGKILRRVLKQRARDEERDRAVPPAGATTTPGEKARL